MAANDRDRDRHERPRSLRLRPSRREPVSRTRVGSRTWTRLLPPGDRDDPSASTRPEGASTRTSSPGVQFIRGYGTAAACDERPAATPRRLADGQAASAGCRDRVLHVRSQATCTALLTRSSTWGSCMRGPIRGPGTATICFPDSEPADPHVETRTTANTEVKYTLVYGPGNSDGHLRLRPHLRPGEQAWSTSLLLLRSVRIARRTRSRFKSRLKKHHSLPGIAGPAEPQQQRPMRWYYTADGSADSAADAMRRSSRQPGAAVVHGR